MPGVKINKLSVNSVHYVDGLPCIFQSIHGNTAKVFLIDTRDFSTKPCYIVKVHDMFAHGETIADAAKAVEEKYLASLDIDERIAMFVKQYPDHGAVVSNADLSQWHHTLTGSCEFGRDQWCREHAIDMAGSMTVRQFIDMTKAAYGSDVIGQLEQAY
jgi:hypothetical protein